MDERPFRLDEFATFYGNHLKWTEDKPNYIRRSVLVNEMYNMLQEYEGKVPPNDQVQPKKPYRLMLQKNVQVQYIVIPSRVYILRTDRGIEMVSRLI